MKKFSDYSTDELREISRKGGINSGKARRRKKQLIMWAEAFKVAIKQQSNSKGGKK